VARRNRERRWADDWRAARQEAAQPDADPNALTEIVAGSPDGVAVEAAAAHPNCPPAVVTLMAADPAATSSVRVGAARHPNLNDSMYERLAADPDPAVRAAVAANPHSPAGVLDRLAGDPDPDVRAAVAGNAAAAAATRSAAALTAG
jgi:hypothetical protein